MRCRLARGKTAWDLPLKALCIAALTAAGAGCGARRSGTFEPRYSTPDGDAPLLQAGDELTDSLQRALDNLDALAENTLY